MQGKLACFSACLESAKMALKATEEPESGNLFGLAYLMALRAELMLLAGGELEPTTL